MPTTLPKLNYTDVIFVRQDKTVKTCNNNITRQSIYYLCQIINP